MVGSGFVLHGRVSWSGNKVMGATERNMVHHPFVLSISHHHSTTLAIHALKMNQQLTNYIFAVKWQLISLKAH